jgi:hypothetical protein
MTQLWHPEEQPVLEHEDTVAEDKVLLE